MKNILETLAYPVSGKGMYEITSNISKWVDKHKIEIGHLNIFIQQR